MAAADFPVGHFTLKLVVNKGPLDPITTAYKEENLNGFLKSKSHRPERHAIRNLLGVIAFRGKKVQEAKDHFNKILEPGEDPGNLNAKANLDYVERHTLSDEDYITSGAGIAASNLGPGISSVTEKMRQGRRYAEQAFAIMYENYHETQTHERYSTAMELYNMAMDFAGDLIDRQEKVDWYLGIGLASMKIFKSIRATENQEAAIKHLKITVSNNCAVINSESADRDMKSDAFLRIGLALGEASRRKIRVNKVDLKVPQNLVPFIRGQEECFKKALEVAVSDSSKASINTRLATIRNRNHDFSGAMKFLGDSIRLDGSKHNFHAYSTRADICLKQFNKRKNAGGRGVSPAELDLLTTAKIDLKFILKEHVSPWDFFNLAEVYYHLAVMSSGRQSEEYIQQALDTCSKGEECQDGADSPDCHKIKGMCLCFIGEHQQALESFKRGVECEENTGWKCGNAKLRDEESNHLP